MPKRSPGLTIIVIYKAMTAVFLLAISFSLLLAIKKQPYLLQLEDSLTLAGKRSFIAWLLEKILNFNPKTLQVSGILAGVYAGVCIIEAVGLWYQRAWARWLVLGLVAIGILPEIFELIKGFSLLKVLVFLANLGVFIYLLRDFPKQR